MKKLIAVSALVLVGAAAGAAAGLYLRPAPGGEDCAPSCEAEAASNPTDLTTVEESSYISLKHQFVVPIVVKERVTSFVVISISLEIEAGTEEQIYAHEPKLQDALLRVMFDHAYMGGFNGAFTESERMTSFRTALREMATSVVGDAIVDVLITEMVRQEV